MKNIEEGLEPLSGHLLAIKRNTINGWYELEIGIPNGWIFKGNDLIECETLKEGDEGILLRISPKQEGIIVDDLFMFVELIINTNSRISAMEREFTDQLNSAKEELKGQAKNFYQKLDDLKEKSFDKFNVDVPEPPLPPEGRKIVEGKQPDPPPKRKRGRPKKVT